MNEKKFKKMCNDLKLDFELVKYNLGWNISELRLYKNEIFKPMSYVGGKPRYEYIAQYQLNLADCV